MSTIPASKYVTVIPGVLSAGGNALQMLGLLISKNFRVPIGTVASFPYGSQATPNSAVAAFFGPASGEAAQATVYFNGFTGRSAIPAALLVAQFPYTDVVAWLQSGNVAQLGLTAIKALSGSLTVVMDGYTYTNASFSLSSATSFSAAAADIQTALNASLPAAATVTGSIAPETAVMVGSISGNIMTVTGVTSGIVVRGALITVGAASGTTVESQLSGAAGGIGTYAVSTSQVVAAGTTLDFTYGQMTVSAVASGTLSVGQTLSGSAPVTANTIITQLGTGVGLAGTYYVNLTQTASSGTINATGTPLAVSFDSTSGSFFIDSGQPGATSTAAFATGSLSASLLLTSATGAILSQGSAAQLPGTFMNGVVAQSQNWATFWTGFDPDDGAGNAEKQLFAAWVNSTSDRFAYICEDTDITPTQSTNAASCMGQILAASNSSGTILVWEPAAQYPMYHGAFIAGIAASVNYNAADGQFNYMYRSQTGLVAAVSSLTVSANLDANGYSYYGVSSSANQNEIFLNNGFVSGPFDWANTYVNQIYLNAQFQITLLTFLLTINAVPYNAAGSAMIETACLGVIAQALNNGTIVPGVTLSATEILAINTQAGANVAGTITQQGWYFQVQPSSPQTRKARSSPPIFFWYTDGGSVQQITLNSIDVQ